MLIIENVYKSYKKLEVLKGVSFNVKHNEIKALIGINGAGKSTLVDIICGTKTMNSGKIIMDGNDISITKGQKLKYIFGYMPQSFSLFNDLTVEENLGYICSIYNIPKEKIVEVSDTCSLKDKLNVLAKNLSGGYKQLLSMAATIIHNPKLIILDEPTSAMDPLFRRKFWKVVKQYRKKGGTVLIITHHLEELLECDSFVCLSGGKIKIDETISNFKKDGFINIEQILQKCESNTNGKD